MNKTALTGNRKVRDFAMAFRARKVSGAFEKRAPGPGCLNLAKLIRDYCDFLNSVLIFIFWPAVVMSSDLKLYEIFYENT